MLDLPARIDRWDAARAWFAAQGFAPFPFQEEVWSACAAGESGLVHAPTGMGKTYAAALGPIVLGPRGSVDASPPLSLLWITPLRALASDTGVALTRAAQALNPHWTVGVRTGDTTSTARARQAAAAADGARDDAGERDAHAVAPRLARALRARRGDRRRRVARAHEQQARRANGARACAFARLAPAASHMGTVGDARQSRRSAALPRWHRACEARAHRARARHQENRDRERPSQDDRALSVGGPPRPHDAAGSRSRDRSRALHPRVHERAVRDGDVVPGDSRSTARLGRPHRAPSRLARARSARLGRSGTAGRAPEGRRMHVEPRPRRRLRAGRPGVADRQPERCRAPAAARRPQRSPSGRDLAHHRRAHAGARARRSGGGAHGGSRTTHRAAAPGRRRARRARAAPRHVRARRRLSPRRLAGRDCARPTPTRA